MTTDIKTPGIVLSIFLSSFAGTAQAGPVVLNSCESPTAPAGCTLTGTNGTNGAVAVGVDGYGNFGNIPNNPDPNRPDTGLAQLRQETPATPENTVLTSFVALRIADTTAGEDPFTGQLSSPAQLIGSGFIKAKVSDTLSLTFIGPNNGDNVTVNDGDKDTQKISSFSGQNFGAFQTNLEFELIQTIEIYAGTSDQQSILYQQYVITNTSDDPITGELLRYADFNLNFNSGFANNGAGFLTPDGGTTQYLATTLNKLDTNAAETSAAITAEITGQTNPTTTDRYTVDAAETVKSIVLTHSDGNGNDVALENYVAGGNNPGSTTQNNISGDPGNFAVAFRNAFTIEGGGEIVYTTQTLWGNQAVGSFNPPEPPPIPPSPGPGVPLPGTLPLLGIALWGLMGIRRRRVN